MLAIWLGAVAAVVALVTTRVSPRPAAIVFRQRFDHNGRQRALATARFVPDGVVSITDIPYCPGDADALLDVHHPPGPPAARTTIVWVHGGAWLSGGKDHIANYLRVLAAGTGCTVVGVGYSIAPEALYPTPVRQVLDALAYLTAHADELQIDPQRLVLAGDSAGAQISAQVATIVTSPAHAESMDLRPTVDPAQLIGMVLFCGAFDMTLVNPLRGRNRWFVDSIMWAFTGTNTWLDDDRFAGLSVAHHVTADFPPTFLSAGNTDPLLAHSLVMADALTGAGVRCETLFFADDHVPPIGHQYQFLLSTQAAQDAQTAVRAFVESLSPAVV